ncbi:MAG: hypothetical protein RLY93_16300 [Sumerlaeia bacterium]
MNAYANGKQVVTILCIAVLNGIMICLSSCSSTAVQSSSARMANAETPNSSNEESRDLKMASKGFSETEMYLLENENLESKYGHMVTFSKDSFRKYLDTRRGNERLYIDYARSSDGRFLYIWAYEYVENIQKSDFFWIVDHNGSIISSLEGEMARSAHEEYIHPLARGIYMPEWEMHSPTGLYAAFIDKSGVLNVGKFESGEYHVIRTMDGVPDGLNLSFPPNLMFETSDGVVLFLGNRMAIHLNDDGVIYNKELVFENEGKFPAEAVSLDGNYAILKESYGVLPFFGGVRLFLYDIQNSERLQTLKTASNRVLWMK